MHIPVFKRPLPFVLPNHRLRKKEYCFVDSEIQILLELQVAKEVQERPICVSLQVVVPKAGGRHRLILDLRWVNESISTPSLEQSKLTELRHCSPRRSVCQARSRERVLGCFRSIIKHKVSGLQMDGIVLSVVLPHLWSGMQSVLFRQTGSGEFEVPGTPHSLTAHASLCGRFTSLRPTRFHYNGSLPDGSHSRVTGMEDKHEQVCLDSVQVTFLGRSIQSTPEGICIRIIQEELLVLKKGVQRVLGNCVASARVIFPIAGQCIVMAKVVIHAKLCLQSLAEENALERAHDVNDKCARHLHWWYKNAECWNCHFLSNQLISLQMLPLLPTGAGGRVSTATRISDSGIGRQLGSQSPVESC